MLVRATAPVRICDIGGWTDTGFARVGAVVNLAVDLTVHVLVSDGERVEGAAPNVRIDAVGSGTQIGTEDACRAEHEGTLDLLRAAMARMYVQRDLQVTIWSDAPPGSGMGTSSATAVALLAALGKITGRDLPPRRLAELAHTLEVEDLGIECGVQDQYAAAFGGIHFMDVEYPRVRLSPLSLSRHFVDELDERLLVVHTGESRLSHNVHMQVMRELDRHPEVIQGALTELRCCAYRMREALLAEDLTALASVINANWKAQKRLWEGVTTRRIERVIATAQQAGAAAAKANGAGGGGTVTLLCRAGTELRVRQAVARVEGASVLPCHLCFDGVRAWEVR